MRFCKFCQCEHPLTDEWWVFNKKGKATSWCRLQNRAWQAEYRASHKEQAREYFQSYYKENKEHLIGYQGSYREQNREKTTEYRKSYYDSHKAEHRERQAAYDSANADILREKRNARYHNDILFRLSCSLRSRMSSALRKNTKAGSTVRDLGCTILELKQYLESKFHPGMTWENHSKYGWHIDHIIPLSSFDLTDREQFLKACHYTNLQPLWAEENLRKHAKLPIST